MENKIEPYWNKTHTKYAIIVSTGYACGWTVMNTPEVAYDSRVVGYVIEHLKIPGWQESFDFFKKAEGETMSEYHERPTLKEFDEFLTSIGYKDMYLPPISRIKVVWVGAGRKWRIHDGGEGQDILEFEDEIQWISFDKPIIQGVCFL